MPVQTAAKLYERGRVGFMIPSYRELLRSDVVVAR